MYHSSRARLLPFFLSWYQKPSLRTAVLPRPGSGARLRHQPGLVWTRLTNVMGGRSRLCAGRRIAFAQCKRNQPPRVASSAACLGSSRPKKDPGTTCMVPPVQNMVPPVLAMLWSTALARSSGIIRGCLPVRLLQTSHVKGKGPSSSISLPMQSLRSGAWRRFDHQPPAVRCHSQPPPPPRRRCRRPLLLLAAAALRARLLPLLRRPVPGGSRNVPRDNRPHLLGALYRVGPLKVHLSGRKRGSKEHCGVRQQTPPGPWGGTALDSAPCGLYTCIFFSCWMSSLAPGVGASGSPASRATITPQ